MDFPTVLYILHILQSLNMITTSLAIESTVAVGQSFAASVDDVVYSAVHICSYIVAECCVHEAPNLYSK